MFLISNDKNTLRSIYYRNPALSTRNKSPYNSVWFGLVDVYIEEFRGHNKKKFVLKKLRNFDREKYLLATRRNLQENI